jgi:hypothetical protein
MKRSARAFTIASTLLIVLTTLVLLPTAPAGAGTSPTAGLPHSVVGVTPHKSSQAHSQVVRPSVVTTNNLVYRGAAVAENHSTLWAIFWEPNNSVSAGYNNLIQQFLGDFNSSPLYQISAEYPDSSLFAANGSSLGGVWVDTDPYPQNPVTDAQIQQEITHAQAVNGWPSSFNNDFLVYTQRGQDVCLDAGLTDCADNAFCSYHGVLGNTTYAVLPYQGNSLACGTGSSPNNDDADGAINLTSGMVFAMGTDPTGHTWLDNTSNEIENKCPFTFGARDATGGNTVLNGHEYILGELWDNFTASCRQIPSTTFPPGTWPICSNENATCAVTQKELVTFGSNGHYSYFELNPESLGCNAHALGDPNNGTYKSCYRQDLPTSPNEWTQCVAENQLCRFDGSVMTVAFGANGNYHFGTFTSDANCNNGTFGDPAPGVVKSCFVIAPPPGTVTWNVCATDNQTCVFPAPGTHELAYGANGHFVYRNVTLTPTSGIPCSSANFGDPAPGLPKACYWAGTGI